MTGPVRTLGNSGRQKTIQQMLQAPVQEPPHPPLKQYECPLCQETVGRKALWVHLKREHQATKQDAFEFVPERDMLPGSLTCRHCYSSFTMEQALVTHFKRSSCPVLTCDWARKLHFGSHSGPPIPVDDHMDPSLPVLLHRYFDLSHPGLIGHNLQVSTIDLVDCWFPLLYVPTSYPHHIFDGLIIRSTGLHTSLTCLTLVLSRIRYSVPSMPFVHNAQCAGPGPWIVSRVLTFDMIACTSMTPLVTRCIL